MLFRFSSRGHALCNNAAHSKTLTHKFGPNFYLVGPDLRSVQRADPMPGPQLTLFLRNEMLSGLLRRDVLRLSPAEPPRTSALKPTVCQFVQARQIHHSLSPAATLPNVCSISAVCVWHSTFASPCAPVCLLPSMIPPCECFLSVSSHHAIGAVVKKWFGSSLGRPGKT